MIALKLSRSFLRLSTRVAGVRFMSLPAHEVVGMPALSPTMEMGTIGKWLMKEGDSCTAGDAICEIETDKASMAFEVQDDFYIAKILAIEGQEVKVGDPVFVSVENEGDVAAFASFEAPASSAVAAAPAPTPSTAAAPTAAPVAIAAPAPAMATTPRASGERVFASPLARRLARDAGLDINSLKGTGPHGRIVAIDVQNAPAASATAAVQGSIATSGPAAMSAGSGSTGAYSDFELSNLARSVASRYTTAKQVVPHYYLTVDLNLAKLVQMRQDLGGDISMTNFFMKAAAGAMKQVPDVNGAWMDTFVRQYEQVDINLVMGTGEGLITPVIRDVGSKGVKGLADELNQLEDSLFADEEGESISSTAELAPGTFSIHNLGMFGVKTGSPIVLPPQSCALALGAINDAVVPHPDTKWAVQPVMSCTLSCDHRVVDGAVAAQWLSAFKTLVENPVGLML